MDLQLIGPGTFSRKWEPEEIGIPSLLSIIEQHGRRRWKPQWLSFS